MRSLPTPAFDPNLDRDYDARGSVASFEAEYASLVALSENARRSLPVISDLLFDPASGMALDIYGPTEGRPVMLWIHGGYWRAGNKEDNGFAAPGLAANGVAVAVMEYSLSPDVPLAEIVRQVRQAVVWLARNGTAYGLDTRRIHVGGSSAGGHLAAMTLPTGWQEDAGFDASRLGAILALNGLYDLEPLLRTKVNEWLGLTLEEALDLSPIYRLPASSDRPILLSVGGQETDAFRDQTMRFETALAKGGHSVRFIEMPAFNHFDITASLADPDGALTRGMATAIREVTP
ncbi:alpha/beta hydrolase [Sulfitobacter sp. KE34]|uniref:alpha/beta hydrolase n=1 Tax=unclassified Sulfitobacter TaxID=196795 RepID=UPI0023E13505|nr:MULTISPECIES: alpha/beta hydrolase [unclassified Sulfitobacter]MDF3352026.1 alpha/beta hydrolase [Sulfitobacter sp. KE12]MDF3355715.1 alpha/beta hydrolase [Sulfitobacter sp. KE27]MDF3359272.1 alpha/beta hydrolase [Sulfitobacter sp. KE33]MDF3366664.1 alpha/beta hydrolase [Sulfitobacter sp. Ks34]MDF3370396.1 alpha/beta hydrolase [Sulfitobacter sp. Ks43]